MIVIKISMLVKKPGFSLFDFNSLIKKSNKKNIIKRNKC